MKSLLVLILGCMLMLSGCGGGGGGDVTTADMESGYWDMFIPSMQADKIDPVYFQVSGSSIAASNALEGGYTGTITGNNVTLADLADPECTDYSGTLSGSTITGSCTAGTMTGTIVNFVKSTLNFTNFAPGDTLTLPTPTFAWSALAGADNYAIRVMIDNANGDCQDDPSGCMSVWEATNITATTIDYNSDGTATEALQAGVIYRVNLMAFSANVEIERTMDIRFYVSDGGGGTTADRLNGDYFMARIKNESTFIEDFIVTFDGDGTISAGGPPGATYSVEANGFVTVSNGDTGQVNADGSVAIFSDVDASDIDVEIMTSVKKGSGFSDASLTGDYHCINYGNDGTTRINYLDLTFAGDGTSTFSENGGASSSETYIVTADGGVSIAGAADEGQISLDGSVISLTDSIPDGYVHSTFCIKKSSGLSNATFSGDYHFVQFEEDFGVKNARNMDATSDGNGTLTFSGGSASYTVAADGSLMVTDTTAIPGQISADGSTVMFYDTDASNDYIMLMIGIRQFDLNAVDLNAGLVAHFPFEGDAADASGNGYDGILNGSPTFVTGKTNQAISLDGVDDFVELSSKLPLSDFPFSYSAWVNLDGSQADEQTLYSSDDWDHYWGSYNGVVINMRSDGSIAAAFSDNGISNNRAYYTAAAAYVNGAWQQITVVFESADDVRIYVDGINVTASAGGDVTMTTYGYDTNFPDRIGRANDGQSRHFTSGLIDEVRFYNRVLSEADIQQLAN